MHHHRLPTRRAALVVATTAAFVGTLWTAHPLIAHADVTTYTPGTGLAETAPFGVNVVYNNANVGFAAAVSNATYGSTSAKATATPYGFGLASLVAAVTLCGEHPIPPNAMPVPLTANSDEGDGQLVEKRAGQDQGFSFGAAHVRAAPGADAQTDTSAFGVDVAGMATVSGGEAHARASTDERTRTRRVAGDTVAVISLLGGQLRFTGMAFHLEQTSVGDDARTGERTVESAVDFGTVTLAGVPVPLPDDPDAAAAQLNTLLGPLGIQILPPHLLADGQFGQELTPMTFRLGGSSAYSDIVAQLATTPQLIQLQDRLQAGLFDTQHCDQLVGLLRPFPQINSLYNAIGIVAPILVAVIVNALAGGGSIDVQVGGARTRLDDTAYAAPTSSRPAPATPAVAAPSPVADSRVPAPTAGSAASPSPAAPARAAASTRCATTSAAARPGCWSGLAPLGATGAFVFFGGLLATDELRRRRYDRPESVENP
jgi:hypothetical protein